MHYSLNLCKMQLVELYVCFFDPLQYIFICNFIISSIVFEIWLKCILPNALTSIYGKLKYTLMSFLLKL